MSAAVRQSAASDAPLTHRRVLKVAIPIVLANITVPILGAVDTGVVGQIGEAAPIGAVGIGAVILSTLYWVFGFLRMGTTGLTAQARGAGDMAEAGALLMRGLIVGGAAGLLFILAQSPVFAGAFLFAPASEDVEALASDYLQIRIWGAPATIAIYAITGWLIAMERTGAMLALQFWMNGVNIVLDVVFVLGFDWGVEGVAVATLIAEWSALGLGLWLCRDGFSGNQWRDWGRVFDPVRLRRMLVVNTDIMLRSILLTLSFTSFLFLGAGLGDVTLAANQVLLQFLHITGFAMDGFAFAAAALIGGAVGARSQTRLRRAAVMTSMWGAGGAVVLAIFFLIAGPWVIDLMTTAEPVRAEGREYLVWAAIAPVIGISAWMLDGIYIGATWTREMRRAMVVSVSVYVAALLLLLPAFGNHGLWAALNILNISRAVTLGWSYRRLETSVGAA